MDSPVMVEKLDTTITGSGHKPRFYHGENTRFWGDFGFTHPCLSMCFFHGFNSDIHVFFMVWCLYGLISLIPISPISKVFRWFLISISNMAKRFGQLLCFPSSIPTTTHRVCSGSQGHRSAIAGETSGRHGPATGVNIAPIKVMTGGWFMALFYPPVINRW